MAQTKDIVITKVFDAPLQKVWDAWTQPEQVKKWWGPHHFTSPFCTIDFIEGGTYVFGMRAPKEMGGIDMYTSGTFIKIVPGKSIEFTQHLSDKSGSPIDPATIGMPADFPKDIRTLLEFKEVDNNQTQLTVTEYNWTVGQQRELSEQGMTQSLEKLETALKED